MGEAKRRGTYEERVKQAKMSGTVRAGWVSKAPSLQQLPKLTPTGRVLVEEPEVQELPSEMTAWRTTEADSGFGF